MATPVLLPRQGQSVESCIIGEWLKKPGDPVKAGEILFTYETDKAAFEEEAKADGTLLAVFFKEGDDVPVLTNVAVIGEPGESFAEFDPKGAGPAEAKKEEKQAEPQKAEESAPIAARSAESAAAVSPRARNAAERLGVDPLAAAPTGPHGRVIERDVTALARSGPRATAAAVADMISGRLSQGTGLGGRITSFDAAMAASASAPSAGTVSAPEAVEFEDVKLPNIRKVIAKSMMQSLSTLAQLTHNSSFDATAVLEYRKQLKKAAEKMETPNITLNDIMIYAVSRVLLNHRDLNAHYLDDRMRYFKHVHMGIAVDTPRGLLVPTLFNADTKSLTEIAVEAKQLAKAAQEGSISPDLLAGGTFTISNLGTLGIESFTPIINPPQTGILGVDCIIERVRTVDGQITVYPAMGLSLTYDHRAVDGAPASRFLMDLRNALENFTALLAG